MSALTPFPIIFNPKPKKSIRLRLSGLLGRELNPGPGGTKLVLYHEAIYTPLGFKVMTKFFPNDSQIFTITLTVKIFQFLW